MELEKYAQEWMRGESGAALRKLMDSETGAKLAAQVDSEKIQRAAKAGDTKALEEVFRSVMSTPEGKAFAQQVQKAVKQDGR